MNYITSTYMAPYRAANYSIKTAKNAKNAAFAAPGKIYELGTTQLKNARNTSIQALKNAPSNFVKFILNTPLTALNGMVGIAYITDLYTNASNNRYLSPELVTTIVGINFFLKGSKMMLSPMNLREKDKWIRIDDRFKPKIETKGNLVNLSKIMNEVSPILATSQAKVTLDHANAEVNQLETKLTEATNDVKNTKEAIFNNINQSNLEKTCGNPRLAKNFLDLAEEQKTELSNKEKNLLNIQTKLKEAKETVKKIEDEKAKIEADAKKTPPKSAESPIESYLINYTTEKTKPKSNETYIPLPLSNQAFLINHDNLKKVGKETLQGLSIISLTGLGLIGVFKQSQNESIQAGLNYLQHNGYLHKNIVSLGNCIGWIPNKAFSVIEQGVSWLAHHDEYGIGKALGKVSMIYGSYQLLSSIELNWIDYKKKNINGAIIFKDVSKALGAYLLIRQTDFAKSLYL